MTALRGLLLILTFTLCAPAGATVADDPPSLSVADAAVTEGHGDTRDLIFTVARSGNADSEVTVGYATSDGTATAGSDYVAASGTLTIPAGQAAGEIRVPVRGDAVDEPDETFPITLTEPAGATIADGSATGTISDDDAPPSVSVTGGDVVEGDDGSRDLTFRVAQSGISGSDVTVEYATSDGTAEAGEDYTATHGTLTIKAGDAGGEVKVPVTGDTAVEEVETVTLTISEPANATIGDGMDKATGIIYDDDEAIVPPPAVPVISVAGVRVNEGDSGTTPALFTVSLSAPSTNTVSVNYVTSDGTATSGADFALAAGPLAFAPGERTKTVSVPVIGDHRDEADETFALVLVDPRNATLADAPGAAVIVDDETPRVAPIRVSAQTTPARERSLPYRFRTGGRVTRPSGMRRSDACAGKVAVRYTAGRRAISTRRVRLREDCTFARRVSFGSRSRLRAGRLRVEVRFLGNAVLLPMSAPKRYVRVGR